MQGRAGGRGDKTHRARFTGQRQLAALVKQPLGAEAALELFKTQRQHAIACGLHRLDDQLVVAARLIEGDPRLHQHLHAILRAKCHPAVVALEHGAAHLGAQIF